MYFSVASLLKVSAKDLCDALTTSSNVTRGKFDKGPQGDQYDR